MNVEYRDLIEELQAKILSLPKQKADYSTLFELNSVMNNFPTAERQLFASEFAYLLIDILIKYNYDHTADNTSTAKVLKEIVTNIAVSLESFVSLEKTNSQSITALFLYYLHQKKFDRIEPKIYTSLIDILTDIDWVFKLRLGERLLFPIHELLVTVIHDFEYSNENLMCLTVALQIFKGIDEQFIENKTEIEKLVQKFNIGVIECIIDEGRILELGDFNYTSNSTIIVKNKKYIIIRNRDYNYFDKIGGKVESELNEKNEKMCYFSRIAIDPNWKFTNFEDFINSASPNCKNKFLSEIFSNSTFNIFYDKAIILDRNTNNYLRLTNPSTGDSSICVNSRTYEKSFEGFYNVIKDGAIYNVQSSILLSDEDSCNVLTFDFILAFIKYMKPENYNYNVFEYINYNSESFYQNQMFESFFSYIKGNQDFMFDAIENYYNFLKNHLDFKVEALITDLQHIFFPYAPFMPFLSKEDFKKYILSTEDNQNDIEVAEVIISETFTGYSIKTRNNTDISSYTSSEDSDFILKKGTFYAKINHKCQMLTFNNKIDMSFKFLNNLDKYTKYISFRDKDLIDRRILELIELIKNVGLEQSNFDNFYAHKEQQSNALYILKILWHFCIYSISGKKIELFYNLIFNHHHTDSILKKDNQKKFFEELIKLSKEQGILLIAKDTFADSGTLLVMYENYKQEFEAGKRPELTQIFDASDLQKHITKKEGKFLYRKSPINTIIFISDNILKGKSIKDSLEHHVKNMQVNPSRNFIQLPKNKRISDIIKANNISDIQIHTMYCLEETNKIELDEEQIPITCYFPISKNYILSSEISEIFTEIYDEKPSVKGECVCMIRYNNMPNKSIFTPQTTDTLKLVGLFNRKKERS